MINYIVGISLTYYFFLVSDMFIRVYFHQVLHQR